jgi:protein CpxP
MTRLVVLAALVALAAAPSLGAQQGPSRGGPERRAEMEQRVRQQFARVVQERLALTDEQLRKLGETTRKFEERRRLLLAQERDARMGLRQELVAGDDKADQQRVARLLDQLVQVQRQRIELFEQEQRELASFMTPVQRAKFAALQEQLRKRLEERRRGRSPGREGARPRGPGF